MFSRQACGALSSNSLQLYCSPISGLYASFVGLLSLHGLEHRPFAKRRARSVTALSPARVRDVACNLHCLLERQLGLQMHWLARQRWTGSGISRRRKLRQLARSLMRGQDVEGLALSLGSRCKQALLLMIEMLHDSIYQNMPEPYRNYYGNIVV